jgi:hypothetical protein
MWGALSDERTGLPFIIAAGPRQRGHSWVRVPRTRNRILRPQIRDSPNLEGHVPVFISPRNREAQVLGSLFVASYDSQGVSDVNSRSGHGIILMLSANMGV